MRIVIVTARFYPSYSPRAYRATELAKEFARQGHQVTVYTVFIEADYSAISREFGIEIKNLGKRKWKLPFFGNSKIGRLCNRAFLRLLQLTVEFPDMELFFLVKKALQKENGIDMLISSAMPYPIHWGVAKAWRPELCKMWVADCGDPYMGTKTDSFKKLFYFKYVEKWFCRKVNYLTIPVESARNGYYAEFRHKIKVIPQGFNFSETPVNTEPPVKNPVPTFAYAGSFMPGVRDPRQFLTYLCNSEKPYKFILYTSNREMIQPFVQRSAGNIEIRSYIPRNELLQDLSKMDFLVNFTNGTSVQVPSKLIDYAILKKPILSIEPGKIDAVAIQEFLNGEYRLQTVIENIEQYNIKNVAQQFLQLYTTGLTKKSK